MTAHASDIKGCKALAMTANECAIDESKDGSFVKQFFLL
tara:strand:+ start:11057 stop:11173 length:117 start_codon:yes stop_codon:yes gene_type:complete